MFHTNKTVIKELHSDLITTIFLNGEKLESSQQGKEMFQRQKQALGGEGE